MPNEFEERLSWHVGDKVNTLGVPRSALDELLETIIFEIVREREITYRSFDEAADAVLADPYMCRAAGERFLTEVLGATDPGGFDTEPPTDPNNRGRPASRTESSSVASSGEGASPRLG